MIPTEHEALHNERYTAFRNQLEAHGCSLELAGEAAWILAFKSRWTQGEQNIIYAAWCSIAGIPHAVEVANVTHH